MTPNNYKFSLILAIALHVALFIFLFLKFIPFAHQPGLENQVNIVKATIISAKQIKQMENQHAQQQRLATERQREQEQARLAKIQAQQALAKQQQEQRLEQQRQLQLQKQQAAEAAA